MATPAGAPARERPGAPASGLDAGSPAWSRYRDNTARHLIGVARDLQTRLLQHLSEGHGYAGLRPSLAPLLSLLWTEARPLTAIAAQLATSKQAASQLAAVAEKSDYLERRPDARDGRSRLLSLSPRGRALVGHAIEHILETEAEYRAHVGEAAYAAFTEALADLFAGLEIPTHADPALAAAATRTVGVLPLVSLRIQRELMEATSARGHAGLKMSHAQVLPLIGPDGARVRELARLQRVSRQAISATARDLQSLGYLRSRPDPRDKRGVVFQLTPAGVALLTDSVAALDDLDATLAAIVGARRFARLQATARGLYHALHLEEEIFEARDADGGARAPARSGAHDIRGLASSLRRQLGTQGTARLAALLEPQDRRSST